MNPIRYGWEPRNVFEMVFVQGTHGHPFLFGEPTSARPVEIQRRHGDHAQPVALKAPNQLGIYDMSGNSVSKRYEIAHDYHDGTIGFRLALSIN